MFVITEQSGVIIFVASSLPPIPTSIIAISKSFKSAKYKNASNVINSKNKIKFILKKKR